ncbi:unnamed protein product [Macrosiphum euphorbiae]|nr:unnamed protein product [Macrosiphum euphorbiae]
MSDSLSALISLQDQYPQNELIQLIKECISSSKNKFNFMWVPSHVCIPGSEKSDLMAEEAVTSGSTPSITKTIAKAQKRILT